MDKIKLSDGRETEVISFAISSGGILFVRVEMDMEKAASYFTNGTDVIVYEREDMPNRTFRGFTKIEYIVNEGECVRVALTRPAEYWED